MWMLDLGHTVEDIPGLPDLVLFLANDVSVVHIFRCRLTHGTPSDERVLALILLIMTGGLLKMVLDWAVLTSSAKHKLHENNMPQNHFWCDGGKDRSWNLGGSSTSLLALFAGVIKGTVIDV
jgi:hypothetical protein